MTAAGGRIRPMSAALVSAPLVPDVHRLAVLRANALGDLIFVLPALDALRAAYPSAELVLVGRAWHRTLFEDRPGPVDRVAVLDDVLFEDGVLAERPNPLVQRVVDDLDLGSVDLAVQLHGGGRTSNPVIRAMQPRVSVGLRSPDAPPLDRWLPYVYWQHEVLRWIEVARLAGARPASVEPRLAVTESDRVAAAAVLGPLARPLVVLHPGATDARRRWPPERFAVLGDALAERGAAIAVTGTATEVPLTSEVVSGMGAPVLDLTGRLSLSALVGVLASASLVVANDTGPLHLAYAVGTPTVGIFWIGNLVNGGPPSREQHRPVAGWRLRCSRCGADCLHEGCEHRESFVDDVTVDEVLEAALALAAPRIEPPAQPAGAVQRV
jgi:ADP-heptose:LPS heptosyltransferase